jgi:hypothetical protein
MMSARRLIEKLDPRDERGQVLPLFAGGIVALVLSAAFVIDPSAAFISKQALQNTADAAAIGAAGDLAAEGEINEGHIKNRIEVWSRRNGESTTMSNCPPEGQSIATSCYRWPYKGQKNEFEVYLVGHSRNFFGSFFNVKSYKVSARAVGVIGGGGPPPNITFASLNESCENHTLVIRLGGRLTVTNAMYIDSGNGSGSGCGNNTHGDAFDIFGAGGELIDPVDILVHGAWETHEGNKVKVAGTTCPLEFAGTSTPWQPGCPHVGQPVQPDPFALLTPPSLDPTGIPNNDCSQANPCYTASEFTPQPWFLNSSITSGAVSLVADPATGTGAKLPAIPPQFYIGLEGERMAVTAKKAGGSELAGAETLTVTRGQLGTVTTEHSEPSALHVTRVRSVGNVVTITTEQAHGLSIGDWVWVNLTTVSGLANPKYNGVFQVTGIPDSETHPNPVEFSYQDPNNVSDIGAGEIVAVRRRAGEATITTSAATGAKTGDPVVVDVTAGDASFNESLDDQVTVDSVSPDGKSISYSQPFLPDVKGTPVGIKTYGRFEGTATIVTTANHNVVSGLSATVSNPDDTSFNGDFPVSDGGPNTTTLTYSNAGPDVPPANLNNEVKEWQRTGGVTTLTAPTNALVAGKSYVIVHLNGAADTSFNGKFLVTAVNTPTNGTFQYAQPGQPNVPLTKAPGGTQNTYGSLVPIEKYSRSEGKVTITTTAQVTTAGTNIIDVADSSFNGTFAMSKVSEKVYTYEQKGLPDVASTAGVAGDGITNNEVKAGTAVNETGGGTVTPDDALAKGIFGSAGAEGKAQGPLLELFSVNPTQITSPSGPTTPAEYAVPAGTSGVLKPGTYYGGICIGAPKGANCGTKIAGSCNTSTAPAATVTLEEGVYIMAGGGFFVCGNTTLAASAGVMIYNTEDKEHLAGAGLLDQIKFNTNGAVFLDPPIAGIYQGMSIWQGPDPAVTSNPNPNLQISAEKCDGRPANLTDILLQKAANGLNGFRGTIYAPAQHALFTDEVSGTANIAVITGCIFINGATSTFEFKPSELFGVGGGLGE